MGKQRKLNNVSSKRRLRKKENEIQLTKAWQLVDESNKIRDLLKNFPAFSKFQRSGLDLDISAHFVTDLDQQTTTTIFNLERQNMKDLYNSCDWGWQEEKKLAEMTDPKARYLIARDAEKNVVAFCHFRFDLDFGVEVLYLYEIQLLAKLRRCGLGKFMLQILELLAFTNKMQKVVLTVLKKNVDSINFFEAMNYTIDETSPSDILHDFSYIIYSKQNKRLG